MCNAQGGGASPVFCHWPQSSSTLNAPFPRSTSPHYGLTECLAKILASIFIFRTASRTTKGWSTRSEAKKTSRATIPAAPPFVSSIRSKLLHTTSVGMRHRRHKRIASLHLSPRKRPHGTRAHTPRPQILVHGACVPFGRGFLSLDVSLAPFYFVALVSAGISLTRKSFSYTGMTGSCLPGAISASSPVLTVSSMSQ